MWYDLSVGEGGGMCGAVALVEGNVRVSFVNESLWRLWTASLSFFGHWGQISITTNSEAYWWGQVLGGAFSWDQLGFWRTHSICRLSCKYRWTYGSSRAGVSYCRTCNARRGVSPGSENVVKRGVMVERSSKLQFIRRRWVRQCNSRWHDGGTSNMSGMSWLSVSHGCWKNFCPVRSEVPLAWVW